MLAENTIHLGDSLDLMRLIPDKSVDLVLTDPPYGIGEGQKKVNSRVRDKKKWANAKAPQYGGGAWDKTAPSKEYFDEIFRISKNQIIWGGNYFVEHLNRSSGWLVWWKKREDEINDFSDAELAYTSFNKGVRVFHQPWIGFGFINAGESKIHPTQKSLKLFQWCLERYSQPNDLILDPFSGSGTTAIAAHNLGRRFICIEKDEDYHAASVQRLKDTQAQLRLF